MERTAVKICGLTNLEDARFAAGALADYLGFIFYPKSPRYIEPSRAGAIVNWIEGPETVGVFVNQPLDDVNLIARQTGIDIVQLHGTESPEYCQLVDLPVIKVFHVHPDSTLEMIMQQTKRYADDVDYLLFDTGSEKLWGGTGKTFRWSILDQLFAERPFFLSGGLHSGNIREACRQVRPFAADISSGVEKTPGIKDFDKIEDLFDELREIWDEQVNE